MKLKMKMLKKWWKKNYFQTGLLFYLVFLMQRAYGGAYIGKHEFLNGFTTEFFGLVSLVPASVAMGLFLASVTGMYVLEKKKGLLGYARFLKALMVLSVFYTLLRSGLFEPIRMGTQYLLDTSFLSVGLVDVVSPLIDVLERGNFSAEFLFTGTFLIVLNAFRYFLYLNISMLYLLGSIGVSVLIGTQTLEFIRERFRESETERKEVSSYNIVPFKKKEQA